jgi:hypothetical protein
MEYCSFRRCPIPVAGGASGRPLFNARRCGASGIIAIALLALALCLSSTFNARAQTTCITGGNAASASGSNAFACGPDARANGSLATAAGGAAQAMGATTTATGQAAKATAGVAIATALTTPGLVAGETFGMTANAGFFDRNAALAFPAAGAAGRNFAGRGERWAVSGGLGVSIAGQDYGRQTTGTQLAGRAGAQVSW